MAPDATDGQLAPRPGGARRDALVAVSACVAAMLLVASRKPDAFLRAQFWAEDGVVWYRQAYELGWASLLLPQNGYFQTVSKATALLAQGVALSHAPLVFALVALLFKLLPVYLLLSARGAALVPSRAARLALCLLYVAHPHAWEVFVNVTNIHWHLALAALLVIAFPAWPRPSQKAGDLAILALSGLSGPFALFLAPIAAWHWFRFRTRRAAAVAAVLGLAAGIQLAAILATGDATRTQAPLGASAEGFFRIVGGQLLAAGTLGDAWHGLYRAAAWQASVALPLVATVLLAALAWRGWRNGPHVLRYLLALGALLFAAALLQPQISGAQPQWPLFARPDTGGRYAFIPIVGLHAATLWVAVSDPSRWFRRIAWLVLAAVVAIGIPASWNVRPYADVGFDARAAEFERARPGEQVDIPVNPPGWSFPLRRK